MKSKIILVFAMPIAFLLSSSLTAQKPVLKFNADKKFKIVQFTDMHINADSKESQVTFANIEEALNKEKPDMVVFTGDIVTDGPVETGWKKATEPLVKRKIPFAIVFGNHDDETGFSRAQLSAIIEPLPYGLFVSKVNNVYGYGNYVVEIKSSDGKGNSALLYCMDSNAYSTLDTVKGYGWFHADQIDWYRAESKKYSALNGGKPIPALAFFHIPLPEYKEAYKNEKFQPVGVRLENECPPAINSGMFTAMLESGDVMGTFCGHDHDNDYMAFLHGIALSYGRFSGSRLTYCDLPIGCRVIELTEGSRSFKTWIRTVDGEVFSKAEFPACFVKSN